jgi:uncharacterized repeat protein (TIGR01451 family)
MATFRNQATLSYAGNVTVSNVVTGELQQSVSVTKNTAGETYTADEVLTYVVSIVNTGGTPLTDLTVTDDLGAYTRDGQTWVPLDYVEGSLLYYVDGVRQGTPAVTDTDPLTITGITIPAGGNVFLVYGARVNEFASPETGAIITNTVSVTGDCLSTPATAQETVRAASEALLTIDKSLNPATVTEGDRLTYTFVIRNFGNTPVVATDDATVTDTFDPILTDLAVTFNGATWVEGAQYTYDEATGLFTTVPTNILVPAATYTRNPVTGAWTVVPGVSTLVVTGTV